MVHFTTGCMFSMHFIHLPDGEQKVSIESGEVLLQVLFLCPNLRYVDMVRTIGWNSNQASEGK